IEERSELWEIVLHRFETSIAAHNMGHDAWPRQTRFRGLADLRSRLLVDRLVQGDLEASELGNIVVRDGIDCAALDPGEEAITDVRRHRDGAGSPTDTRALEEAQRRHLGPQAVAIVTCRILLEGVGAACRLDAEDATVVALAHLRDASNRMRAQRARQVLCYVRYGKRRHRRGRASWHIARTGVAVPVRTGSCGRPAAWARGPGP